MDKKIVHDLAVAYAQAKLLQEQQAYLERSGYDEEISSFLKWYYFAMLHIPDEEKEIDKNTLG